MNKHFRILVGFMAVGLTFLFLSCATFSLDSMEELNENDFFNNVQIKQQEAVTEQAFENIIAIYEMYIEKFTENTTRPDRIMEARYEIGYVNHYLKRYDDAEKIFRSIIAEYETGDVKYAPQWIMVLSKQLKEDIQTIRKERILAESEKQEKREALRNKSN